MIMAVMMTGMVAPVTVTITVTCDSIGCGERGRQQGRRGQSHKSLYHGSLHGSFARATGGTLLV